MKCFVLYLRVSTDGQTTQSQRRELMQVAERAGWQVVEVYEDADIPQVPGSCSALHSIGCVRMLYGGSLICDGLVRGPAWAKPQ